MFLDLVGDLVPAVEVERWVARGVDQASPAIATALEHPIAIFGDRERQKQHGERGAAGEQPPGRPRASSNRAAHFRPRRGKRETSPINPQCGKTGRKHATSEKTPEWGDGECKQEAFVGSLMRRQLRHPTKSETTSGTQIQGKRYIAWASMARINPSGRRVALPTARPPWKRNDAHPCVAFQTITGLNTMSPTRIAR